MQKRRFKHYALVAVLAASLTLLGGFGTVFAESASSTHYKVNETQFGIGGGSGLCSDNYCSSISVGDTTVGDSNSTTYKATNGFNTTTDPYLEVSTDGGISDLGTLDVSRTATASSLIKVRNYLSSGYVIQITGGTPSQGTHSLTPIATPSTSQEGSEQFGINFAHNTAPAVGTVPVQVPDTSTSFGYATDDYNTANLFKYADGDVVAQSDTSSGETDYTLSLIVNISNITAGGKYSGSFSAVVVPVY